MKIIKLSIGTDKKTDISYNITDRDINMLYLNQPFLHDKLVMRNLKKKLHGYKSQDNKKNRWDKDKFISYDELLEKLVISKLLCDYCRKKCKILSEEKRDYQQWT
jgi:hypothetical protein